MPYVYSDPTRQADPHALPNVEIFLLTADDFATENEEGWYYQFGFPGCMPDSDPIGPFASYSEALDSARED